jgi:LuxR family transcriptional regulator, maltose regulon positive regulatory protein
MFTPESLLTDAPPEGIPPVITLTKLQRPRVGRRLVARPRLLEQLDATQSLTLVVAPAGGGKTTLLSAWLETCGLPSAWVSLDEHDDDLRLFATYLIKALRTLFPVVDPTLAAMSAAILPSPGAIARSLLNDLASVEQDFILVLDDYHVIRNQAIHDLITDILLHPPRTLRLFIAARQDPPLPLAALRAHGDVTELRRAELWFTPEEAGRFLVESMRLTLDERAIAVLTADMHGWPAGLRLAALFLRQHPAALLTADTLGDSRYIMDYLTAEVFSHLPIFIQEFLLKTSLLDQLSGPLCEAVTGIPEKMASGQPILEWLERSDLFLTPIDDRQRWYRCHDLFKQFLRHRLEQTHGPTEIAALHLRASAWYAANGELDQALLHALAAGDMTAATQIVAQHRHALLNQTQWQHLDRWIHLFPREVIDEQPDLLLIEVAVKGIRQQFSEVQALLDRVEALLARNSSEPNEALWGEVGFRRSYLSFWSGDWARGLSLGVSALQKTPADWRYVRVYLRLYLAACYQCSGDLPQAYATIYASDEPEQDRDYHMALVGSACFIHWIAADLPGMAQATRQALAAADQITLADSVNWSRLHLGLYYYQRNDLGAAEQLLLPLVMHPYASAPNCYLNGAVLLARIRQVQNRPEEARAIVATLLSWALEFGEGAILSSAQAFQAELALRQGRLAEAGDWAAHAGSFQPMPRPYAFVPYDVLAQTLLTQDTPASRQQARELLSRMNDYYSSIHYTTLCIRVLALQAMLDSAEGDEPRALAALADSIALAAPGGFLRHFVDLGPALKPLLRKLARQDVAPAYINEILAAFGPDEAPPFEGRPLTTEPAPTPPASTLLTNRELDVLQLLAKRYTDKEIAEALVISPKTVSSHIDNLSDKLGVRGRRPIVEAAKAQGILAD